MGRYCCVLLSVLLVAVAFYFLMSFVTSSEPPQYPTATREPTEREMRALYTAAERRMFQISEGEWTATRDLRDRCEELSEQEQMHDVDCRAELMFRMRSLLPSRVHAAVRFLDASSGADWYALELTLGEDLRAWFKPCACTAEEVGGRRARRAPVEPRRGYPPLLSVSTRVDPRFLRSQSFGMSEWARWVVAAQRECGEELQFTKHHSFPRLPGCLLLWNNATAHHIADTLHTDLNHVLQSLSCERVRIDDL